MPFIILVLAGAVILGGLVAYHELDIEAYPNPVPPLVEVIAQPDGSSAEEVERYVTIPIELGLTGMPGIDHIRSSSLFGLSDVKCYFKWGTNYKDARQEVLNRLQSIKLPAGVEAGISPWNPVGEIFRYTVHGKGYDLSELKTAQDWILERQFKHVPGVMDVTSFGGETKQYQVGIDPYRLAGQQASLEEVMQAISRSNENAGGQRLVLGEQSYNVRGVGILHDIHDIDDIVIAEHNGVPVRLREVANSAIGHAPRLGIVGIDDEPDVVQGIVLMRYGSETSKTLEGVHAQLDHIRTFHLLPPGMEVVPYYDRGRLVAVTTHTVLENLLVGMGLVSLVLFLFLGNTRAAIITAINIPIALLVAFSGLVVTNTSANLISLGAVDFGIVVDSTVIMVENIYRHVGSHGTGTMKERVFAGAREVTGPMTFSTLIIAVAFLPLFTMGGVAGVIFSPMAHTYAFAIGGAILMALTLTPVLATRFVRAGEEERESAIMRALHRLYTPLADAALARPRRSAALSMIPIVLCVVLYPLLGN
ncbi:MAG: efflux RND transporter permease subunit, partial [Polyangiaceae bacterium]